MTRTLLPFTALALALTAACSSSSTPASTGTGDSGGGGGGGHATVSGTVDGKPFAPLDAIALKGVYDSSYPGIVTIFMANQPDLCALFRRIALTPGAQKANLLDLGFTLGDTTSTSTVAPGTYTPAGGAFELDTAGWDATDATCNVTHDPGSSAEKVVLTQVGATYAGTFDVTLGTEHITGSFSAPLCDLMLPDASTSPPGDGGAVCWP